MPQDHKTMSPCHHGVLYCPCQPHRESELHQEFFPLWFGGTHHLDRNEPALPKRGGTQLPVIPSHSLLAVSQNKLVSESELLTTYLWEERM